jgi:hypothetical protein
MGQHYSHFPPEQRVDESGNLVKHVDVRVSYVSKEPTTVGHFINLEMRLQDLDSTQTLHNLARRLRSDAMHDEVFLMVDIGPDFAPSGWLYRVIDQSHFKGIFAGIFLTGLEIRGKYSAFNTPESKIKWWNATQQFLTELNLGFRAIGEITCHTMREGVFNRQTQIELQNELVNINRVVFQPPSFA